MLWIVQASLTEIFMKFYAENIEYKDKMCVLEVQNNIFG